MHAGAGHLTMQLEAMGQRYNQSRAFAFSRGATESPDISAPDGHPRAGSASGCTSVNSTVGEECAWYRDPTG